MHFDGPSLVVTLEAAATWLNQIIDTGRILVKFRRALNVSTPINIVNNLLQEEAILVPIGEGKREPLKPNKKEDYYSSVWPDGQQ